MKWCDLFCLAALLEPFRAAGSCRQLFSVEGASDSRQDSQSDLRVNHDEIKTSRVSSLLVFVGTFYLEKAQQLWVENQIHLCNYLVITMMYVLNLE